MYVLSLNLLGDRIFLETAEIQRNQSLQSSAQPPLGHVFDQQDGAFRHCMPDGEYMIRNGMHNLARVITRRSCNSL